MALCLNCGKQNPDGFKFCGFCSVALPEGPQTQVEERKVVSILFVDLVGFTARFHEADPEDVRAVLGPYHALLKREIERFGGTLEKFIGDAVMAVFGAPLAREDDAERAVRTALRITEAVAEVNDSDPGLDLSVRAAVNSGEGLVIVGARPELGEGMVTGDVVNTASRLQTIAPVNCVVVGEVTHRSTRDAIVYEELEPVAVKGKPEPVTVWRALSAKSRFGVDFNLAPKTAFIGRDYQLDLLKGSFETVVNEPTLRLISIVGEPGVGKSRLLAEFFSFIDVQEDLITWRQGRSLPYGEGITFWALGEIVKAQAGILESDSSEQASRKLRDAIASVLGDESGPERHWFLSRLGPLVGVEVTGSESVEREESFTAWRRFLEAIARKGPLVLVFEDIHWAVASLLEFIEHLADRARGVPMLVICTARPEIYDKSPAWAVGKRNAITIPLPPLNDSETGQLLGSLLSQAVLPAEVHAALLERAGGNPLYAEEFVRMLSDRGILQRKGHVLTLAQDVDIPVPETLHALIAARLDTLSPSRKSLLHDAAVVGKVFWSGAVAAIGETDEDPVRESLHELGTKELVRPAQTSSMEGQKEYVFWHALIRDVCYGEIPRAARAKKHQAMAAWIQAIAERLDDHAEVLAYHYSTALELSRAAHSSDAGELEAPTRRFLVIAADRARRLDPAKALSLYRHALELLPPDNENTPRVLREAGMVCSDLGLLPQAQSYLEDSIAHFSRRGDLTGEALALRRLAGVLRGQGRSDRGRILMTQAVELLEQGPPGEELAGAYAVLALFEAVAGSSRAALEWGNKAVVVARGGNGKTLAVALDCRGVARLDLGDVRGLNDLREAIEMFEGLGEAGEASKSYNGLAENIWLIEGPRAGLDVDHRAQEVGHSHGYVLDARWAQQGTLPMLFELGRWEQLLEQAKELITWSREHTTAFIESFCNFCVALVLVHRGGIAEAMALETGFLPLFRESADIEVLAPSLAISSLIHACSGNKTTALASIREFEQKTEQAPYHRARYLPYVLRAVSLTGENDQAERLIPREGTVLFARDRHALVTARAIVAEAKGEFAQATELYAEAERGWKEYGNVFERAQALLGKGRCLSQADRPSDASGSLHQAREIFTELGAAPLIKEVDDHLGEATALTS